MYYIPWFTYFVTGDWNLLIHFIYFFPTSPLSSLATTCYNSDCQVLNLAVRLSPQCPLYFQTYISLPQTLPLILSDTEARKGVIAVVPKLDFKVMKCGLGIRLIKSTPDDYSVLVETSVPPTQWFHLQEKEKPRPHPRLLPGT